MLDTDHDGTSDVDELEMGRDPNDPSPMARVCGGTVDTSPEYGCGESRIARRAPLDDVGIIAGAAVALVGISVMRRRRA